MQLLSLAKSANLMGMFKRKDQGKIITIAQTRFQPSAFMHLSLQSLIKVLTFYKKFDEKWTYALGQMPSVIKQSPNSLLLNKVFLAKKINLVLH